MDSAAFEQQQRQQRQQRQQQAPAPLRLPGERVGVDRGSPLGSGSRAPRGQGARRSPDQQQGHQGEVVAEQPVPAAHRRLPAHSPYYSGDPGMLTKVAKSPLANMNALVSSLVPGAELTTEALLNQFADEELTTEALLNQ